MAPRPQVFDFLVNGGLGLLVFLHIGNHGEHDLHVMPGTRHQHGAHLQPQQCGPLHRHADGTPAHCRVLFLRLAQIGQNLVSADVKCAEYDRLALSLFDDLRIVAHLRGQPRKTLRQHELQVRCDKAPHLQHLIPAGAACPRSSPH